MVTTRLAKKIAVSEGKELSPLRKLPSPKRAKRGSKLAKPTDAKITKKDSPSKVKKQQEEEDKKEAEEELQKALNEQQDSESEQEEAQDEESEQDEDDNEIEGFESTDDEQEEEDNEISKNADEPKKQIKAKKTEAHQVKKLPKDTKQISKKQSKVEKGVIYIGRLPDGFEEKELNEYFNQFGEITNVKLPRNKTTGRSRHFAFVEFSNKDDASVAQETMNNYLILNHQLKVNLVNEDFKPSKKFRKTFFKVQKLIGDVNKLNANVQAKRKNRKEALIAAGIKF